MDLMTTDEDGQPRRVRWWNLMLSPSARRARRRLRQADNRFTTVAHLDCGIPVRLPQEQALLWHLLPDEYRADLMATMNEQVNEDRAREVVRHG
jgi:hypothetical protein